MPYAHAPLSVFIHRFYRGVCMAGLFAAICFPASQSVAQDVIYENFKLIPSDGERDDRFGKAVAIDNGIVAVGAWYDEDYGSDTGSAYLFDASTGNMLAKILPSDVTGNGRFGGTIAMDDGVVAVGAYAQDLNGAAYLFDASTGDLIDKLLPNDGASNDRFGHSIAIDNGVVAIGAVADRDNGPSSGSAYLFDALTGTQIAKLLPVDGTSGDGFGYSIAISGNTVAVGAWGADDNGRDSGAAYTFNAVTGEQIARLLPTDGTKEDRFGFSISVSNGIVVVGAPFNDEQGTDSGSAYLFDAITGEQLAKLQTADADRYDSLGWSVAIENGVVAVGAFRDINQNGYHAGSATLFDALTGNQIATLLPTDGSEFDAFGISIAIDNNTIVVGADLDDLKFFDSGSAYIFKLNTCTADLNDDGRLNGKDVRLFIQLMLAQDPAADLNGDGTISAADLVVFVHSLREGCP